MKEIWCGVCENGRYGSNCLTCQNERAWEARQISQWLDKLAVASYAGDTKEERERIWKLSQTLSG